MTPQELREAALRNRRRLRERLAQGKARRDTPFPTQPIAIETRFAKELLSVVLAPLHTSIMERLTPEMLTRVHAYTSGGAKTFAPRTDADEFEYGRDYLPQELESFFASLRVGASREKLDPKVQALLNATGEQINAFNLGQLSKLTGIRWENDPQFAKWLEGFLRENTNLIKSISFEHIQDVRAVLREPLGEGLRVEALAKRVQERFDVSKKRALLIARDQTLKGNADLNAARQQSVGIHLYTWSTAQDERVRGKPGGRWGPKPGKPWKGGDHFRLHGKRFSWDKPPVVDPRTGRRAHPGKDIQCRCIAIPVMDDLEAEV